MQFNHADIHSIIDAQKNGSLTVFVGAGFSKFSETKSIKFPSWSELIIDLQKDLNNNDETDFLKVAQLYFLEFGEFNLYKKLRKFVPLHANPSEFHFKLFDILEPKYVITTNWDNLLEKTIETNGLMYDIVKTESDLIKSNLPRKLVKIHGDFDSHNIVFKEDDYLNYSINNPLFDNFLKHILSTTTVLFLGYSYSDNDLKQIIKWIEKHSKVSPPRFLLSKDSKSSQAKYLENHGIKVLEPINIYNNIDFKQLYTEFFDSTENMKKGLLILPNNSRKFDDTLVIDYFYNKLIGLSELHTLLPEQITNIFSNCTVDYHKNCFGLHFHSTISTTDFDYNIRKIYSCFFDLLKKEKEKSEKVRNAKIKFIMSCFLNSGILFIRNKENDYFNISEFITEPKKTYLNEFITFSDKMPKAILNTLVFDFKSENNKVGFFNDYSPLVIEAQRKKEYLLRMIYKFNTINFAKLIAKSPSVSKETHAIFTKKINHNFANELITNNYPNIDKNHFQPLIDLLNFKLIYKFYYDSIEDTETFVDFEKNRKNGGFGFDYREQRSNDRLIQLLEFCANNDITLDIYTEFKMLMNSYVKRKIEVGKIREQFHFSQYDLFILIKYLKYQDLWRLIDNSILYFVKDEAQEGNGEKFLTFSDNEKYYLKETFKNLLGLFKQYAHSFKLNDISNSFTNLIMVLAIVKWEKTDLDYFINEIKDAFIKSDIPHNYIESVNNFILIQYKLYKTENERFLEFIDAVLNGFISGKFKVPFYQEINRKLSNVYRYSDVTNIRYENEDLVQRAISSLEYDFKENDRMQRYFIQKFLLPIYAISTEEIQNCFIKYFNKMRISDWKNVDSEHLYEEIFRELDFLQYDFEVKVEFITFLTEWVNNFNEKIFSDLAFLKEGGIDHLIDFIDFLIKQKNLHDFQSVYDLILEKMKPKVE